MKNNNETVVSICPICGSMEELYLIGDEYMCRDCLRERGYFVCDKCGEVFEYGEKEEVELNDGRFVCEDCAVECGYRQCDECGEWHIHYMITEVDCGWGDDMLVCHDCLRNNDRYRFCDYCENWYNTDYVDMTEVADGDTVCEDCLDRHYIQCDGCGGWINEDYAHYDDDTDEYYCEDCWENRDNDNTVEHNYYYKPTPVPKTHKLVPVNSDIIHGDELLFGVELEVDKGNDKEDTIREIAEASDDVYMKHDGSLGSRGFEIVTHPCSLEYHSKDFAWRRICQIAKDNGYKSHDARTCGLHVHVGRHQLGETHSDRSRTIANILLMVDRHWDTLVKFSRRNEDQLHWASRPDIATPCDGDSEEIARNKALRADNGDRYQALNLCNNSTIEFRLFNGTLKRDTILATLQFVSNICQYAMSHTTTECMNSTWEDITTFVTYDELTTYLHERGIVTANAPYSVDIYESDEKTVPKYPEGTRVRYIGGILDEEPVNLIGTVLVSDEEDGSWGVAFDGFTHGHNLGGLIPDGINGWWCLERDLTLAS